MSNNDQIYIDEINRLKKEIDDLKAAKGIKEDNFFAPQLSLDDLPIGIYKTTSDGRILYANKELVRISGCKSIEELKQHNSYDFYVVPELRLLQTARFVSNDLVTEEYRFFRKDGTIIWVRDVGKKVYDDHGLIHFEGTIEDITERVETEARLKDSEEKYRDLIETMEQGLALHEIILNADGEPIDYRFIDVNTSFEKLTGLKKEYVVGKTVLEVLPDTEKYWIDTYGNVAINGISVHFVNYSQELEKYYDVAAYSPKKMQFVVVIADATEKILAENALRESELKLRTLINTIPDIICFKDGDGRWLEANDNMLKLFNLEDIDYHYKTDLDLAEIDEFFSSSFKNCHKSDGSTWQQGVPSRVDEVVAQPDGYNKIFDTVKVPLFDEFGKRKGMVVVGRDVTDNKALEEKIKQSEFHYRKISELLTDYVYLVKLLPSGKIEPQWIIGGFDKITGYDPNEVENVAELLLSIIVPEDLEHFAENHQPQLVKLEEVEAEYRIINKSGEIVWISDHIKPFTKDEEPGVIYQIGAVKNITERKKYEARILESSKQLELINEQKDRFFSIIAHDLKSPLSSFLGLTKMFAEQLQEMTIAEIQDYTSNMLKSAGNVLELLENLLEWSKMQRGKKAFNPELINLNYIFDYNIDLLANGFRLKRIKVNSKIDNTFELTADVQMINTILRNLLSNAMKFTHSGGSVEINAIDTGNDLTISVSDSGIGMNKETLENLFNIARKVSRPGTDDEPSSGLGLLLCKEFVDIHKGKIWAESEVGKGTTFYVSLPKNI